MGQIIIAHWAMPSKGPVVSFLESIQGHEEAVANTCDFLREKFSIPYGPHVIGGFSVPNAIDLSVPFGLPFLSAWYFSLNFSLSMGKIKNGFTILFVWRMAYVFLDVTDWAIPAVETSFASCFFVLGLKLGRSFPHDLRLLPS